MTLADTYFELAEEQDDENLKIVLNLAGTTIRKLTDKLDKANTRLKKLTALEVNGVDNWEWYDDAMNSLNDEDEED